MTLKGRETGCCISFPRTGARHYDPNTFKIHLTRWGELLFCRKKDELLLGFHFSPTSIRPSVHPLISDRLIKLRFCLRNIRVRIFSIWWEVLIWMKIKCKLSSPDPPQTPQQRPALQGLPLHAVQQEAHAVPKDKCNQSEEIRQIQTSQIQTKSSKISGNATKKVDQRIGAAHPLL